MKLIEPQNKIPQNIIEVFEDYKKYMNGIRDNLNFSYINMLKFSVHKKNSETIFGCIALNIRKTIEIIINSSFITSKNEYSGKIIKTRKTRDKFLNFVDEIERENPYFLPIETRVLENCHSYYFCFQQNSKNVLMSIWTKINKYLHNQLKFDNDYEEEEEEEEVGKLILEFLTMSDKLIELLTVHIFKLYKQPYIFYINIQNTKMIAKIFEVEEKKRQEKICKSENMEQLQKSLKKRNEQIVNIYLRKTIVPNEIQLREIIEKCKKST